MRETRLLHLDFRVQRNLHGVKRENSNNWRGKRSSGNVHTTDVNLVWCMNTIIIQTEGSDMKSCCTIRVVPILGLWQARDEQISLPNLIWNQSEYWKSPGTIFDIIFHSIYLFSSFLLLLKKFKSIQSDDFSLLEMGNRSSEHNSMLHFNKFRCDVFFLHSFTIKHF